MPKSAVRVVLNFAFFVLIVKPASAATPVGVRYFEPVIDKVLYRGGGAGGTVPLTDRALTSLCQQGFSRAIYLYTNNFQGPKTVECQTLDGRPNHLVYETGSFRLAGGRKKILTAVAEVIEKKDRGPIFVHCWNGWHASGEIAAIALIQFCDFTGPQAAQYWSERIGDKGNLPRYGSITRVQIGGFTPFGDIRAKDTSLCPKP